MNRLGHVSRLSPQHLPAIPQTEGEQAGSNWPGTNETFNDGTGAGVKSGCGQLRQHWLPRVSNDAGAAKSK